MRYSLSKLANPPSSASATLDEVLIWLLYTAARFLSTIVILIVPFLYDDAVPESASDPRWMLLHVGSTLAAIISLVASAIRGQPLGKAGGLPLVGLCYALLSASAILSCLASTDPNRSWWFIENTLSLGILFVSVYILRDRGWYRILTWAIFLPAAFNGLLAICQIYGINDASVARISSLWNTISIIDHFETPAGIAPAGTFINRNLLASWLVMVLPLGFYLLLSSKKLSASILISIILCLGIFSLIHSKSRASWISAIAAAAFFAFLTASVAPYRRLISLSLAGRISKSTLVYVIAFAIPIVVWTTSPSTSRFRTIFQMDASSEPRIAFNLNGLQIAADHFVNGSGIGTFRYLYPRYNNIKVSTPPAAYSPHIRPNHAHNDVLQAFIELGLLGGCAMLGIFGTNVCLAYRLGLARGTNVGDLLPLFLGTSIFGVAINCLMDFPLQMPTAAALLSVMSGMLAGSSEIRAGIEHSCVRQSYASRWLCLGCALICQLLFVVCCLNDFQRRKSMKLFSSSGYEVIHNKVTVETIWRFEKALALYSWDGELNEYRARAYGSRGGLSAVPLKRIIEVLEESLHTDPSSEMLLFYLGRAYQLSAVRAALDGDNVRLRYFANKLLDVHRTIAQMSPNAPLGWILGGLAQVMLGDTTTAIRMLDVAVSVSRQSWTAQKAHQVAELRKSGASWAYIAPLIVDLILAVEY